jgi:hypothetical protein
MGTTITRNDLDTFTTAYLVAMLWSSSDTETGEPHLDATHNIENISQQTLTGVVADCKDFQEKYADLIEASGLSRDQAGHDFWLTRNHHGTGFWDRDISKELGERLTNAAQSYKESSPYVGDDNLIYI